MNTFTDNILVSVSIILLAMSYGLRDVQAARLDPPLSTPHVQTDNFDPDPIDSNATLVGR